MSGFKWDKKKAAVAISLAHGATQGEAAGEHEVSDRTVRRWLDEPEFAAEVDRLSLMVDIAGRAARLRIAMRVIRQKTEGGTVKTEKDVLEWLKFAQSETDGVKLDLSKLAALGDPDAPVADS